MSNQGRTIAIVDAGRLAAAFSQMEMPAKGAGEPALWQFSENQMVIDWHGSTHQIPCRGRDPGVQLRISSAAMKQLVKVLPETSGEFGIEIREWKLHIGSLVLPYVLVERGVGGYLPVDVPRWHVLGFAFATSSDEVEKAGISEECAQLLELLDHSVRRAAESLSWLGINAGLLDSWIREHVEMEFWEVVALVGQGGDEAEASRDMNRLAALCEEISSKTR